MSRSEMWVFLLMLAAVSGCGADTDEVAVPSLPEQARIVVEPNQVLAEADPHLYGHFIENLGPCIYGGVWDDEPAVPTVHGGMRADVLNELKPVRPSVLRWPGGCFSDGYHWRDGIGPRRPVRINRAWWPLNILDPRIAPLDPNTFGTDEFLTFCGELGAEPYINVNFGTGSAEEAAAWVAYCNAETAATTPIGKDARGRDWADAGHWARQREKNGQAEPYGVTYWGIGNEIFGFWELGHTDAATYAEGLLAFRDSMTAIDPGIRLVAVGADREWNETVLATAGETIDALSLHVYYPGVFDTLFRPVTDSEQDYYSILAAPALLEGSIRSMWETIEAVLGPESRVRIAVDEWNLWWSYKQLVHTEYSLRDGLFAAMALMVLQHCGNWVNMANLAQMVNTIGMINTSKDEVFATPVYYAFRLLRDYAGTAVVRSEVESETYENEPLGNIPGAQGVPYLMCSATTDPQRGTLTLFVVNRHRDDAINTRIVVRGSPVPVWTLEAWELNADEPDARNDYDDKTRVQTRKIGSWLAAPSLTYPFPPHSATALVLSPRPRVFSAPPAT